MTLDQIRTRVAAIRDAADTEGDYERAHRLEDELHTDVLSAIAAGTLTGPDAVYAANLALTTGAIDFERWYG